MERLFIGTILLLFINLVQLSIFNEDGKSRKVQRIAVCNTTCDQQYDLWFCNVSDAFDWMNNTENNIELFIDKEVNILTRKVVLMSENMIDVQVIGTTSAVVIYCNMSSIVFHSIADLHLINLTLIGCGFYDLLWSKAAALMIHECDNIKISNLIINRSLSIGLVISNATGEVLIDDSSFNSNGRHKSTRKDEINGGGLVNKQGFWTKYNITGCTFEHNMKALVGNPNSNYGTGHGGGLEVIIQQTQSYQFLTIHKCSFTGNEAENGGGVFVNLNFSKNSSILITNSRFSSNVASNAVISNGGGLQISLASSNYGNNIIKIRNCSFTNNTAYFGGGLSINCGFSHHGNKVDIQDSHWIGNKATSGAAVDISRHFPFELSHKSTVKPVSTDCTFVENVVSYQDSSFSVGYGAVSVMESDVEFQSKVLFDSNIGSAINVTWATIHFNSCIAIFQNNTSINGGAIFLTFARLMLYPGPHTAIHFVQNTARRFGGAVYSFLTDDHMLFSKASCPFAFKCTQIDNCQVEIFFINNTAIRGKSIYLPSLLPCRKAYTYKSISENDDFTTTFHLKPFHFDSADVEEVATAPFRAQPSHAIMLVYPGKLCHMELQLFDELNNTVPDNLTIFEVANRNPESTEDIMLKDTYIYNYSFTILGPEDKSSLIYFQTVDKPLLIISRNVKTKHCPPGYKYNDTLKRCMCAQSSFYGIMECDSGDTHFSSSIVKGVWCSYVQNRTTFVSSPCYWFCNNTTDALIPLDLDQYDNFLCPKHRMGILCSECEPGYTTYNHDSHFYCASAEHKHCQWGWLIFIAYEIVPMTLLFIVGL